MTRLLISGCALALAACAPPIAPPDTNMPLPPRYWRACSSSPTPALAQGVSWWAGFRDPALDRLMGEALSANLTLQQAEARVLQARALAAAAGAALAPRGELRAGATDLSQSLLDPNSLVAKGSPAYERHIVDKRVDANANWDLDLAGGNRAARDAARADAESAEALMRAARDAVAADVADTYLQLRGTQARLRLAQREEATARQLADLVAQRVDQGVGAARELDNARASWEGVRAGVPTLQASADAAMARLDVLTGQVPGLHAAALSSESALPLAPAVALGQGPADLLRRRFDVRAAEQRVRASHSRVASALAAYYPKLSISALFGWNSAVAGKLFNSDALEHELGLGLRWRLFDFGRLDAEVAAARGRKSEALAAYRAAVLNAALEVETSYSLLVHSDERARALQRQIERLQNARERTASAYAEGAVGLLDLLDLDRQLLQASDQRVVAQAEAARAAVSTWRALGGSSTPAGAAAAQAFDCAHDAAAPSTTLPRSSP